MHRDGGIGQAGQEPLRFGCGRRHPRRLVQVQPRLRRVPIPRRLRLPRPRPNTARPTCCSQNHPAIDPRWSASLTTTSKVGERSTRLMYWPSQFETIAAGWREGLSIFARAIDKTGTPTQRAHAPESDFGVAEAAGLHFDSVAPTDPLRPGSRRAAFGVAESSPSERSESPEIETIITAEIDNAKRLFTLTRQDPRIGFEASNHYYYLPLDLVEKVIKLRIYPQRLACANVTSLAIHRSSSDGDRCMGGSVKAEGLGDGA